MNEIKDEIKSIIIQSGWTLSDLVKELHVKYGWSESISNLSNKLSKGTLRYKEAQEIAEVVGYNIKWIKNNQIITTNYDEIIMTKRLEGLAEKIFLERYAEKLSSVMQSNEKDHQQPKSKKNHNHSSE